MQILPSAVLFCCSMNALRSPMAEGIMKRYHGDRVFVDSVGVSTGDPDPMMIEVMREMGIDMARHVPKPFALLADDSFDVVVALSEDARAQAARSIRYRSCDLRLWKVTDPSLVEGTRAARLGAYRQLRDELRERILDLFPLSDHVHV
jgi:protein-tyrosine-phosphatase